MDYLDLYMCHRPDPDTPVEETVRAMEDLARQGKILYWGVSEWTSSQIIEAQNVCKEMGARLMYLTQPRYNLFHRNPKKELFPTTKTEGIGNVTFSPLAHGMLTGKYHPGEPALKGSRAADPEQNTVLLQMYWKEEYKQMGQRLVKIAEEMGITAAQLATAWCLRCPDVSSVILGARTVEQLQENIQAIDVVLSEDVISGIEGLVPCY